MNESNRYCSEKRMESNVELSGNSYTLTSRAEALFFLRQQYLKEF